MKIRWTIGVLAIVTGLSLCVYPQPTQSGQSPDDRIVAKAKAIHEHAITLDTHVDIGGAQYATPELDPGKETNLRCDLVKMKKGGLDGVFLAVFVGQRNAFDDAAYKGALDQALVKFDAIHRLAEKMHPELCQLAVSPDQVPKIAKTGKRAIMIGVENGYPIGNDLSLVKRFYDLGARYITLSHSGHNQICDSSNPGQQPLNNGLSAFGKQVVAEMNRLGIMVDVSHIAEKSFWDVIQTTKSPIIASHSGCAVLNPVDRNLTDEQLKALSRNGGVIQVVALGSFLKADPPERRQAIDALRKELGFRRPGRQEMQALTEAQRAEYEQLMKTYQERMRAIDQKYPTADLSDFVNHIDHAVKVAGIDHVGIGTDFDGGGGIKGFNDDSEALNVTIELVRRGYSEKDIRKIWGENLLRVWREVEKAAGKGKSTD
jgi:microsomal dipeptidase-like Zn-dependent dipeptidase